MNSSTPSGVHYYEVELNDGKPSRADFDMMENESYGVAHRTNNSTKLKTSQISSSSGRNCANSSTVINNSRAIIMLFVLMLTLLLTMLASCVAFAVEITKLKSEIASLSAKPSFQQPQSGVESTTHQELLDRIHQLDGSINQQSMQCHSALENTAQQLNSSIGQVSSKFENKAQQLSSAFESAAQQIDSSIDAVSQRFDQNYTALEGRIQELTVGLGTRGQCASFPLDSCAALPSSSPSGHYWVRTPTGCSAVLVYCDPTRSCGGVTGGWRRVAELDMTNSSQQCPSPLRQRNNNNIRTCGTDPDRDCSSLTFPTDSLSYSKVCGKIRAYQFGSPDSYGSPINDGIKSNDIDATYLDGISLTYGPPRQHIWTFFAAPDEAGDPLSDSCPCINRHRANTAPQPPAFVGTDYFCDTGASGPFSEIFYGEDPLWDGAGCGPLNDCCSFNDPPWFYKQLPQPTTDSIEMRVCRDEGSSNEDIAIEMIEIYVQ